MVDKDRIQGSVEQAKGKVKEVVGKVTGDSKLEGEGQADQLKGKVQKAVGGLQRHFAGQVIPHRRALDLRPALGRLPHLLEQCDHMGHLPLGARALGHFLEG